MGIWTLLRSGKGKAFPRLAKIANSLRDLCIDVGLPLWVVRTQAVTLLAGFLLFKLLNQARDLLIELITAGMISIAFFLLITTLVWTLPIYFSSVILLEKDRRLLERLTERKSKVQNFVGHLLPGCFGAATYIVIANGIIEATSSVGSIAETAGEVSSLRLTFVWHGAAALLAIALMIVATQLTFSRLIASTGITPAWINRLLVRNGTNALDARHLYLLGVWVVFALGPSVFPHFFAQTFPRAWMIPLLLGANVPALAVLSALGRVAQIPILGLSISLVIALNWISEDRYDIRTTPITHNFVDLDDTLALWMEENRCAAAAEKCPRPIIIAASGGASRAAFFTTSVLGQLFDDHLTASGQGHGLSPHELRSRIFAISSVSGGAVGTAIFDAALAASQNGKHPCKDTWQSVPVKNWQECLGILASGDLLSAGLVGLVFRDLFHFLGLKDRGVLLEEALEERFRQLVKGAEISNCPARLDCPFLTFRPTKGMWIPLPIFNATSVRTGTRVVSSVLSDTFDKRNEESRCSPERQILWRFEWECILFLGAQFTHGFIPGNDVRLSTAAHLSARFPIISPPAKLVDRSSRKERIVDWVVDGGYYENYGAQTAIELALAIRTINEHLKPFILILSNDPAALPPAEIVKLARTPLALKMVDIAAPLLAVATTRSALAWNVVDQVNTSLTAQNCYPLSAHIRVHNLSQSGEPPAEVSMSWWLSKPTREYLLRQTREKAGEYSLNSPDIKELLVALSTSSCRNTPYSG